MFDYEYKMVEAYNEFKLKENGESSNGQLLIYILLSPP